MFNRFFSFLLLFSLAKIQAQEIPPIDIFTPQDYKAEDQNWSITQYQNNFIYAANNLGLLEYNGAYWRLFKSPNNDILRSVRAVENKIYSGGYMDFGYWEKDEYGYFLYTSLSANREFSVMEDEEFWQIIDIEDYVLFQSFDRIYIYSIVEDNFRIIESEVRINKMFKVKETIYFQKAGIGLFKIENGIETLVLNTQTLGNEELINVYNLDDGLLLQTKYKGFFRTNGNKITSWNKYTNEILSQMSAYSSIRLTNGNYLIGTISNGVVELSSTGDILLTINQSGGLSNNTVLSIKEDNYGNAWLGLDNGINVINLSSPFKVYKDKLGVLGTIYTSAKTNDYLYLGTNQGLFYRRLNSIDRFRFVTGTKGQVWTLKVLKGELFCGHDQGTFIVKNDIATKISDEIGTWIIKDVVGQPNLLIQGNYKGLYVLEFKNGLWKYRNKITGFDISSRFIEFTQPNTILVNHELKGVYKINIDSSYYSVLDYKKIPVEKSVKSGIVSYNNSILYSYNNGVLYYEKGTDTFKKDSILSSVLSGKNYLSGKFIDDFENNKIWGFTKNEIVYIEPGILSDEPKINSIAIPDEIRKNKPGYENVLLINNNNYLIGTTSGYLILDLDKIESRPNQIYLNEISYNSRHNGFTRANVSNDLVLENKNNSIKFNYSVPNYDKLTNSKYQYRLIGMYDEWSDWSQDSETSFENLPHGDYKFEARSITGSVISNNLITYSFSIEKPWFLKPLAVTFYIILLLAIGFAVHYFNKRYYKKQKQKLLEKKERELELEQLENQRQLVQFKNENLQLDIESKNRELGTATMNLVKRNELLNNIKEELSRIKSSNDIKSVIRLINSSLNNTSDWELFEQAFNNVDKEFMKRIKTLHPSITSNDLRLCAYLRLNLSSKEIAPLLNISHKSVEVKRYRLRKKIGLDHEQSLTNYILEI